MSRRRTPNSRPSSERRVRLVCTGRGRHKLAFLGYIVLRDSPWDDDPFGEEDPDHTFFDPGNTGDPFQRAKLLNAMVESVETADWDPDLVLAEAGPKGLKETRRERFSPSRLCERCFEAGTDVRLRDDRLLPVARAAADDGVSELDISQLG